MTTMSVSSSTPFTVHDLEEMPDDGHRYELVDGELLVSPAPGLPHQVVLSELHVLLHGACPEELVVLFAPFAVQPSVATELQPDMLVAWKHQLTMKNLPRGPLLAVEVLSPSGRKTDLELKRAAYQQMGTQSYWIIDPDVPDLLVLELGADGAYVEVARVSGEEVFEARLPFPVRVVPNALLGWFRTR